MNKNHPLIIRCFITIVTTLFLFVLIAIPAISDEYVALKGVNTMLPEINHVANGFISIAGYQAQGYSTITIN